jgi:flagellar basal-body rod protein FlgF
MLENTAYVGLSHEMALRRQLDVVANNLANMNTTGYKAERVLFGDYMMQAGAGDKVAFVLDKGTARNLEDGRLAATDNPLDLAIEGRGYFVVDTPQGQRYTRSGHFRLGPQGQLVTGDGLAVLDKSGKPITLTADDVDFRVNGDGSIVSKRGPIAVLDLVSFQSEQSLLKEGSNLYAAPDGTAAQPADNRVRVRQGMVESSNVVPIIELSNMLELQKTYQATRDFLDKDSDLRRRSIQSLAKVG